jgi:hypothetical protein
MLLQTASQGFAAFGEVGSGAIGVVPIIGYSLAQPDSTDETTLACVMFTVAQH